jgi:hypothetical protein
MPNMEGSGSEHRPSDETATQEQMDEAAQVSRLQKIARGVASVLPGQWARIGENSEQPDVEALAKARADGTLTRHDITEYNKHFADSGKGLKGRYDPGNTEKRFPTEQEKDEYKKSLSQNPEKQQALNTYTRADKSTRRALRAQLNKDEQARERWHLREDDKAKQKVVGQSAGESISKDEMVGPDAAKAQKTWNKLPAFRQQQLMADHANLFGRAYPQQDSSEQGGSESVSSGRQQAGENAQTLESRTSRAAQQLQKVARGAGHTMVTQWKQYRQHAHEKAVASDKLVQTMKTGIIDNRDLAQHIKSSPNHNKGEKVRDADGKKTWQMTHEQRTYQRFLENNPRLKAALDSFDNASSHAQNRERRKEARRGFIIGGEAGWRLETEKLERRVALDKALSGARHPLPDEPESQASRGSTPEQEQKRAEGRGKGRATKRGRAEPDAASREDAAAKDAAEGRDRSAAEPEAARGRTPERGDEAQGRSDTTARDTEERREEPAAASRQAHDQTASRTQNARAELKRQAEERLAAKQRRGAEPPETGASEVRESKHRDDPSTKGPRGQEMPGRPPMSRRDVHHEQIPETHTGSSEQQRGSKRPESREQDSTSKRDTGRQADDSANRPPEARSQRPNPQDVVDRLGRQAAAASAAQASRAKAAADQETQKEKTATDRGLEKSRQAQREAAERIAKKQSDDTARRESGKESEDRAATHRSEQRQPTQDPNVSPGRRRLQDTFSTPPEAPSRQADPPSQPRDYPSRGRSLGD